MCYIMASHHNCGHLHQRFAQCFTAKHNNAIMCNMQHFPIWQHTEVFPCPDCRAQRRADAEHFLVNKGRRVSKSPNVKSESSFRPDHSDTHSSGQSSVQNVQQSVIHNTNYGQHNPEDLQLQVLVDALRASPQAGLPAQQDWIPPSRRSITVNANETKPTHIYEATSPDSSEMLSVASGSNSGAAPAYPNQTRPPSPPLTWILKQ